MESLKEKPPKLKKITVMVPEDLLHRAMKASGEGITPTITEGLEKVAARTAYQYLLSQRGKLKLKPIPWLRED